MIKTGISRTQVQVFAFDERIGSDNDVRFIDWFVKHIINSNPGKYALRGQARTGAPSYSASDLLKLYLYGYLNRVSSSRRLERECHRNIEVCWLLNELAPDHKTIADFRKDQGELIKTFSADLRKFLLAQKLVDGAFVAVDGTKIKANASRDVVVESRVRQRLARFIGEHAEYLKQMDANDQQEEVDESSVVETLRSKCITHEAEIARLNALLDLLKKNEVTTIAPADPEARQMKTRSDGIVPGYNVQMCVDGKHGLIISEEVTTDANDLQQIESQVLAIEQALGAPATSIAADSGYCNPDMIERCETLSIGQSHAPLMFVSQPRKQGGLDINGADAVSFIFDAEKKEYRCSEGKALVLVTTNKKMKNTFADIYQSKQCEGCRLRELCTGSKVGRYIVRYHNQQYRDAFAERMKSTEAKEKMRKRSETDEHVFGTIKIWAGKIPILLRGKAKVTTEIKLYSAAFNIRRLLNIGVLRNLMNAAVA